MRGKFILVLLFTIVIGIQPALAQSKNEAPAKPAAPEKPAKKEDAVININLVSDKDFKQALEAAGEVELVNEGSTGSTSSTRNDNTTNQEKPKNDKK